MLSLIHICSEKHLIKAVTGREVPAGQVPSSVGVIVLNIDTAVAIARAVYDGLPLLRRIVTVSGGAIKNPCNCLLYTSLQNRNVTNT